MELIFCLQFPLNFYKAVDSVIETWLTAFGLSVHLQQHSLHRPALDVCSCSIKTLQITQDIELNLTNLNQRPYDIRVLSNFEVDVHLQILGIQIDNFLQKYWQRGISNLPHLDKYFWAPFDMVPSKSRYQIEL